MDPHSRAPKKNTSRGNEVLPQDTTHLIKRLYYQRGSRCQDPAGKWTTWRPPDYRIETKTAVVWSCLPFIRSGQKPSCEARWKGEEDSVDKGRGGKTTSGKVQAWSSASPQRAVENREKWKKLVAKSSVVPQRPSRWRDRWWWWWLETWIWRWITLLPVIQLVSWGEWRILLHLLNYLNEFAEGYILPLWHRHLVNFVRVILCETISLGRLLCLFWLFLTI